MADLPLKLACWNYDRSRPLMDGRVKPEGITLDIQVLRPREAFPRMLERREFDVSEMSLASYVSLVGRGGCPFVAIPVALSKVFRHDCIYVRPDAGIRRPQDLKGKHVGTTQYGSTGLVFMKGMLEHDYGVAPKDIHWCIGGLDAPTQRPLLPLDLPASIKIDFLTDGETLEGMLAAGELDALLSLYIPESFIRGEPHIARLFANPKDAAQDYYRRTRIFPIMHTVVIREDVHRANPWVAPSLYRAFCQARDVAVHGLYDTDALHLSLPFLIDHVEETWRVFGKDFWAYGLEPNRPTLAAIGQYVHEQHLSPRPVAPEELFVPNLV
ncbi:MAG TPA: ABC transporter substrate-binding protein [Xanthobacteraceae bacterium]|nr:ABC transporter substrate-binding protein [Xanthobacteraceae bacterium]